MAGMKRSRADLVRVGVFVVGAGAVLFGGILWIAGSRLLRPVNVYTVLFEKSVSGLNAGANVEFQGVVVGRVRDVELTGDIPPKVAVAVDLDPDTPVRTDTVAALVGSLVTGIKFIQLQGGSEAAGFLASGGTIRGDVTSLEQFRDQLGEIANRAVLILRRLEQNVFTNDNSAKAGQILADLGSIAKSVSGGLDSLRTEQTGEDLAKLVDKLGEVSDNLNKVITDFYGRREALYGNLQGMLVHIDEAVRDTRDLIRTAGKEFGGTGVSLGALITELTAATNRLQETIDLIQSDPSLLLRGREVPEREFEP